MKYVNGFSLLISCFVLFSCANSNIVKDDELVIEFNIDSIVIESFPNKTTYYEGESFSTAGLVVKAIYSNGMEKIVTDYTYTPAGKLSLTDNVITLSYSQNGVSVSEVVPITILEKEVNYNVSFDYITPKVNYGDFTITGGTYEEDSGVIILTAAEEKTEYTLSGYYNGQIINNTKNTILTLKGAYIENNSGKPAIVSTKKLEISSKSETENYIISTGENSDKIGTVYCYDSEKTDSKNLELGGKGTCYILGLYHGIKASEVKAKGSGHYYVSGSSKGSAINCNNFTIEPEKSVTLCLGNAKNGIKADETISIQSGTLWFENVSTALKTDTSKDDDSVQHFIALSDCNIYTKSIEKLYSTETSGYTDENIVMENFD